MDKKTQAWLVIAAVGGALVYLVVKDKAGGAAITIGPGLATGLPVPSNGRVALQLQSGATWVSGQASSGTLAPRALPVPGGTAGLLPLQVSSGLSVMLQWNDAAGTTQNTFLTFA